MGEPRPVTAWYAGVVLDALFALALSLIASVGFVALNTIHSNRRSTQTQVASDALMHSQRIGKATPNAVQGSAEGFRQLEESRKELNNDIALMTRGGSYQGRNIGEPSAAPPIAYGYDPYGTDRNWLYYRSIGPGRGNNEESQR